MDDEEEGSGESSESEEEEDRDDPDVGSKRGGGGGGRGLHSSTLQHNLSRFCHSQSDTYQRVPQKLLTLS